ncbi:MAG: hypothetical protein ACHQT7_02585 [Candidatus Levyibacteriota bacterium]
MREIYLLPKGNVVDFEDYAGKKPVGKMKEGRWSYIRETVQGIYLEAELLGSIGVFVVAQAGSKLLRHGVAEYLSPKSKRKTQKDKLKLL